jgi:tRNA (adenine57-N1/adenine58-N1)-methyltransferase
LEAFLIKVLLLNESGKTLVREWNGEDVHTDRGCLYGKKIKKAVESPDRCGIVESSKGGKFLALVPLLRDQVQHAERGARPIYEYDSGLAAALMSLERGMTLLEAGAGSGCATMVFATVVYPGRVVSFEKEERFYEMAKKNLEEAGVENVELHNQDLFEAYFEDRKFDAVFLDLLEDVKAVKHTAPCLKQGRYMCVYVPNKKKIDGVVKAMKENGFVGVEVMELGLKKKSVWKCDKTGPCFPGFFVLGRKFK